MRLTTIMLIATLLQVSAATLAQKVSLNKTNASLKSVLKDIRIQSGYDFVITESVLKTSKPVNINVKDAELKDALDKIFSTQSLTYSINKTTIMVKEKEATFLDNIKSAFAAIDVRGRVVDEKGQPLPGVTVKLKDESQVTTTDNAGSFILKSVNEKAVVVISYIGYLTKEFNATADLGTIALEISNSKLDEVQIMAYGTTSQRLNTGDIVSVKATDIEKQPVNNPLLALQGRIPGLTIIPASGLAGSSVNLQIRGKNSLNFQTEPLIVVDGLPIVNNIQGLGQGGLQQLSSLSFINPNEIESIDVLKDADATSIYGSRGANGVVLITTKKGKAGQTKIDVNAQSGIANVDHFLKMLNTQQYLQIRKKAYSNSGIDISTLTPTRANADVTYWDENRNTDWQKDLIGGTAKYYNAQGAVSGGNNLIQYIIGGNYHKETTVFADNNSDKKGSAHMSLTGSSNNQKFKATISASYMADNNTLPGIDFTQRALTLAPNAPNLYKADGSLNWEPLPSGSSSWDNPYASLYRDYNATIHNLLASGDISYKILPNLILKTTVGYNELNGKSFLKSFPFAGRSPEESAIDYGKADFFTNSVSNLSLEPQINFNTHIYRGSLNVLLGGSIQNTKQEYQSIDAQGASSDAQLKNLASATVYLLNNTSSQYKYAAIFARLNYNWDDKYLINITARRDGSSRFGPGNQFGNFGSVGMGWIFTQEDFIKSAIPFMSYGKLRLSYGTSGNDGIGDYQYLERYDPIMVNELYQGARGYSTAGLFNAYYKWEVTKKLEVGFESGFLKDRILLNISYFRNRSDNQLLGVPLASIAGPGGATINLPALIQNKGLEITLSTDNVKNNSFTWSSAINFTTNSNKLLSYPNFETSGLTGVYEIGQPFYGVQWLYKYAGVNSQTGAYQFKTIDGKIVSDPSDPSRPDGGRYLRMNTLPKYYGGIGNSFKYKEFSLDVFFQFTKQLGLNPLNNYLTAAGINKNLPIEFLTSWQNPGDQTNIQRIYSTKPINYTLAAGRALSSDYAFVDASFIRLKNLSFSYNIPPVWKDKLSVKNLKIYIQGQNLLTITKYKGLDPETQSQGTIPPLRVLTLGLQATL